MTVQTVSPVEPDGTVQTDAPDGVAEPGLAGADAPGPDPAGYLRGYNATSAINGATAIMQGAG